MKKSSRPLQAVGLILAGLVCFLAIPLLAGSLGMGSFTRGPDHAGPGSTGQATHSGHRPKLPPGRSRLPRR